MAKTTRKKSSQRNPYYNLIAVLVVIAVLLCAAAVAILVHSRGRGEEIESVSSAFVSPTPAPTPEPTEPPVPTEDPDPLPNVDITQWNFRLVRSDTLLPENFVPDLMDIESGQSFDARAGANLLKLIEDARAAGYGVYCCSGYRSYDTQYWIWWNHIDRYEAQGMTRAEAEAATRLAVNYPGGSEHQLGLAMDLLEYSGQDMEPYIGGSGLMLWLDEHCADYGFIIRYPDGKTDITGVEYEPWHLRYVGSAAARYIMDHGLCLEEFLALYEQ